jgi:hypothetical protein
MGLFRPVAGQLCFALLLNITLFETPCVVGRGQFALKRIEAYWIQFTQLVFVGLTVRVA